MQDSSSVIVEGLTVQVRGPEGNRTLLRDITFELPGRSITCVVGPSGAGKTLLLKALLGLLHERPGIVSGRLRIQVPGHEPIEVLEGLEAFRGGRTHNGGPEDAWYPVWRARMRPLWSQGLAYAAQLGHRALDPTTPLKRPLYEALRLGHLRSGLAEDTGLISSQDDARHVLQEAPRRAAEHEEERALRDQALELLRALAFTDPEEALELYPAQLSGGMAQRAAMALTLAGKAPVLFADEPTTGLDPDTQDELIDLLRRRWEQGLLKTLVVVTHNFAIAEALGADRVMLINRGQIVEKQAAARFLGSPGPNTPEGRTLLTEYRRLARRSPSHAGDPARSAWTADDAPSSPRPEFDDETRRPPLELADDTLPPRLIVEGLSRRYQLLAPPVHGHQDPRLVVEPPTPGAHLLRAAPRCYRQVLPGVSLVIRPGEIVGLSGRSGAGKSTLASCLVRLVRPDAGRVLLDGVDLLSVSPKLLRAWRRRVQMLFQKVSAAIHPRMRVEEALMETARHVMGLNRRDARAAVEQALAMFQLEARRRAYPRELSGGELRRVGLARLMLTRPDVLIVDEPTVSVDAAQRASLLDQLAHLAHGPGKTSILLISHDEQAIRYIADRELRLEDGRLTAVQWRTR